MGFVKKKPYAATWCMDDHDVEWISWNTHFGEHLMWHDGCHDVVSVVAQAYDFLGFTHI